MICLGLGSNLGDREGNIAAAVARLAAWPGVTVERVSSLYETAPLGYTDQPDFLNAVASVSTTLTPHELLAACLAVERALGRERKVRWGPRTVDIDVLFYDDVVLEAAELTLPHPRFHERCFVLVPLAEIAGEAPVYGGKTAGELAAACDDGTVRFFGKLRQGG
ncbi:2-amino-4-hydroxy-6-hydroxymethyldihydropteridine diphosphokinase [Anaeroselena agilis]|uniref:2-amino-4-hydroxy-6-hydroxymethyldihydropteridine diphosphokinase n=1 Tax=Anaeroselena agilis TaxID=3063788 RepID=A0ABU3NWS7_9FIRM|nr:2-amino-4-hydroxy-6-hydroxymethyldihydropteridine diphosphokinase [Selenomonadales bacterium 4137-cl]